MRAPEGTSLLPDGSIAVVEFTAGNLLRVRDDGHREVLCAPGPGVAGTALGLDGALYVVKLDPARFGPGHAMGIDAPSPAGVFRLDLRTRALETLYTACDGQVLSGPDDLVVDRWGDLWISDMIDECVYWCRCDGSRIRRVIAGARGVNGIALSPDHARLYIADSGKLLSYTITARGELAGSGGKPTARTLALLPPHAHPPDGMRTEACGNIVCACWGDGLYTYQPDGRLLSHVRVAGARVINVCFGGKDRRTMYLAALPPNGLIGKLLAMRWPRPGMCLPV